MTTNYPGALDTFSTRNPGDTIASATIDNLQDAVAALQAKAGVNGSAATTSLDYKTTTNVYLTGSGVPSGGTGANGNLYMDTATGIVYSKAAGSWSAIYTPSGGSTPMIKCLLTGGGSQSVNTGTLTQLTATTWNTEESDTSNMHDPVTNSSRITVPSAGLYMVEAQLYWQGGSGAAGGRETIIYKNGVYQKAAHVEAIATKDLTVSVTASFVLATNDYIEIYAYQTSGGTLTVAGNVNYNWFQVTKLST